MSKNEQTNETKQTRNETDKDSPLSIVEEARLIRNEILQAKEALKTENDRKEKIESEALLSSTAGGHIETKEAIETPQEYAKRVMEGGLNARAEEGD